MQAIANEIGACHKIGHFCSLKGCAVPVVTDGSLFRITWATCFAALLFPRTGLAYLGMVCSSMNVMFGLFNLGGGEIILILALVLILFGAKKLPELAKGLGTGIKEFKKATRDVTEEVTNAMDETPTPAKRLPSTPPPASTPETSQVQAEQTVPQSSPGPKA
jgi:sec-independent protein translocase protein TatA